jgi:hypothetical protein
VICVRCSASGVGELFGARGHLTLETHPCHCFCAARSARQGWRAVSTYRGRLRTSPSGLILAWRHYRYLKRSAFVSLTFGCDGARAAAPIANARTAFIVASKLAPIANLPQLSTKLCRPGSGRKFSTLATLDLRERVEQPWERTLSQFCFFFARVCRACALRLCGPLVSTPASSARNKTVL